MNDKRILIETWFKRVWAEEDGSAIDEMMHGGGKAIGLGGQEIVGPEQFKVFHNAICNLLSNIQISIDKYLESEDWVSVFCTLDAKSKDGTKDVNIYGMVLFRIEDQMIVEGYNQFDFMGIWGQLGLLPKDSFEQGLQGQKIL